MNLSKTFFFSKTFFPLSYNLLERISIKSLAKLEQVSIIWSFMVKLFFSFVTMGGGGGVLYVFLSLGITPNIEVWLINESMSSLDNDAKFAL